MIYTKYFKMIWVERILSLFFAIIIKIFSFNRIIRKNNDTILILSLHRLGDTVFTLPAINSIKQNFNKKITIVCFEETEPIFKLIFSDLECFILTHQDFYWHDRLITFKAKHKILALKPSIIFDLTTVIRSASILLGNKADKVIGSNEIYFKSLYTHFILKRKKPHLSDIYLDITRLYINKEIPELIFNTKFNENGWILIHPFASYKNKEWPLNQFIKLANFIMDKYKCKIIFPINRLSNEIKAELNNLNIDFMVANSIKELINEFENGSLLIGNDSGPVNIANLFGIPTFTIYGPTNSLFHKPKNGNNRFVFSNIKCSPKENEKMCFTHGGIFCPSNECMQNLNFEQVKEEVMNYIKFLNIKELSHS